MKTYISIASVLGVIVFSMLAKADYVRCTDWSYGSDGSISCPGYSHPVSRTCTQYSDEGLFVTGWSEQSCGSGPTGND